MADLSENLTNTQTIDKIPAANIEKQKGFFRKGFENTLESIANIASAGMTGVTAETGKFFKFDKGPLARIRGKGQWKKIVEVMRGKNIPKIQKIGYLKKELLNIKKWAQLLQEIKIQLPEPPTDGQEEQTKKEDSSYENNPIYKARFHKLHASYLNGVIEIVSGGTVIRGDTSGGRGVTPVDLVPYI